MQRSLKLEDLQYTTSFGHAVGRDSAAYFVERPEGCRLSEMGTSLSGWAELLKSRKYRFLQGLQSSVRFGWTGGSLSEALRCRSSFAAIWPQSPEIRS